MRTKDKAAATHDLSTRKWGRNYNIVQIIDGGAKLRAAIWATPLPQDGDYLILRGDRPGHTTRYSIDQIEPCWHPGDMAFVSLTFAPRHADA